MTPPGAGAPPPPGAPRPPWRTIGRDGWLTLAAALLAAAATGGLSLLAAFLWVARAARRTPADPDGPIERVVVLGARLGPGGAPTPAYRRRLDRAARLARRFEGATLVLLGGRTTPGAPSEAEAGRRVLAAEGGVDPRRIEVEEGSRDTLENLRNYRERFGAAPRAALVTSRWHLARASLMARGLNIAHVPCAAEAHAQAAPGGDGLAGAVAAAGEAFLVHWYVVGRFVARRFGRRATLARIT